MQEHNSQLIMSKLLKLLILFASFSIFSCSTDSSEILENDTTEALLRFIPEDYTILDIIRGDLNNDGKPDLLLVLEKQDATEDQRRVLLLTGQKNSSYRLIKKSDNLVYCHDCGGDLGDPYQTISISEPGLITIEHFGGDELRWARTVSFKYIKNEKDWFLLEDALVSSHIDDPDDIDVKILTTKDFGEVKLESFDIYQ